MSSQHSDQSSVSDIGSTQDPDWIPPKRATASSTDNSEDEGWIDDSFEETFGKAQDDVNFDLGCLDKIEEDYEVEKNLAGEVEGSLVETDDEVFEKESETAQGVDLTETDLEVATIPDALRPPASIPGIANHPASVPDAVNPPASIADGVTVGLGEDAGQLDQEQGGLLNVGEVAARKSTMKRIKMSNLFVDPEEYVRQQVPKNTKKSTSYAMKLYNSVMAEVAKEMEFEHEDLKEVSVENLPWRLSKFFMVVRKLDGTAMNASTLETIYASLARYFSSEYEPKIDIKQDVTFKVVKENVDAAKRSSTADGQRPGKHKARAFQDEHIAQCWDQGSLGRRSPKALTATVHFTLISNLGFRGNLEIYNIRNEDLVYGPFGGSGVSEWIEVSERITKTRSGGSHNVRMLDPKVFADEENPATCPVRTLLEFRRRKTTIQNLPDKPYMLGLKQSAVKNPERENFWFNDVRMGEHTIGKLLPLAFAEVGIDVKMEHYSNTSARKTLMEGGLESGVPSVLLSKVAGQASLKSIQHYVEGDRKAHKAVSLCVSRKVGAVSGAKYDNIFKGVADEEVEKRNKRKFEAVEEVQEDSEDDESAGITFSQSRTVTEETIVFSKELKRKRTDPQTRSTSTGQDSSKIIPPSYSSGQNLSSNNFQQLLPTTMLAQPVLSRQNTYPSHGQQLSFPGDIQAFPGLSQPFPNQSQPFPAQGYSFPAHGYSFPAYGHSFPAHSQPFPGQNMSFPGQIQPFPGQIQPFPGQIKHYPGQYQHFSGQNQPFSGQNQPFPGQNQFYSGQSLPYPGQNLPYPGQNLPYPGQNLPYPGQNLPFPGQYLPFPTQNFPYPGQNIPFPGQNPPFPGQNPPFPGQNQSFKTKNTSFPDQNPNQSVINFQNVLKLPLDGKPAEVSDKQVKSAEKMVMVAEEPAKEVVIPGKEVIVSAKEVVIPAKEVLFPAKEVLFPAKEEVPPAMEVVPPAKDVVHPAKELSNQAKEMVYLAKEVVKQSEEINKLAKDGVEPAGKIMDHGEKATMNVKFAFAKFLAFPHWPSEITGHEESGVNVRFSDGTTSGTGGAVALGKLLPFTIESANKIIKTTRFKSGKHSLFEFKKACSALGLKLN